MNIKVLASGSSGNCYRIDDGKSTLLLDAGIKYREIQAGCDYRVHEIAGCLISHLHGDHAKAVDELLRRGAKVFGPPEVHESWNSVRVLKPWKTVVIGTFGVTPFDVEHDCECFGYHIESSVTHERLVYFTDGSYIPFVFKQIDYWLVEANHSMKKLKEREHANLIHPDLANRIMNTHASIEQVLSYFKTVKPTRAKGIWLIHLSNDNSDADEFKKLVMQETGVPVYVA